jgi:hypothetical protein
VRRILVRGVLGEAIGPAMPLSPETWKAEREKNDP